jgi:hypothetical protein
MQKDLSDPPHHTQSLTRASKSSELGSTSVTRVTLNVRLSDLSRIKDRQLPSRLLKIEQGENLNDLHVKLCDSAHFHPEVQYATLSHAWGRDLHLKLTSKNMEKLQQGIPISKLPRTFADAAELTNSLSLRYL